MDEESWNQKYFWLVVCALFFISVHASQSLGHERKWNCVKFQRYIMWQSLNFCFFYIKKSLNSGQTSSENYIAPTNSAKYSRELKCIVKSISSKVHFIKFEALPCMRAWLNPILCPCRGLQFQFDKQHIWVHYWEEKKKQQVGTTFNHTDSISWHWNWNQGLMGWGME